ncbi:MAG: ATP-binding cassette domain-containing protein [Bacteroidia bacterium]|nr:ATP-binding cassette domain-containing protein [Bacteroidia bacterium]
MISLNNISVEYNGHLLLENIGFLISRADRIGLVGKNGAGKSTLLKIIAGIQTPSYGEVAKPKDIKIGYLPQDMIHQNGRTVFEEAAMAFDDLIILEKKLDEIQQELERRKDYESEDYLNLIQQQSDIYAKLEITNASKREGEIEKILFGLGFERKDFQRQTSEFSGGWRMRIELAKILLKRPDVLLLDEPTNHLDIEAIIWFENFLKQFDGSVVLISHDKSFLDNVTNRTIEIVNGKIYDYKTYYSHYLELRKERIEQQEAAAKNQQKYIEKTEELINKYRAKASKAAFAQSLIKKLEKLEKIEIDDWNTETLRFRFSSPAPSGKIAITVENVQKKYGDKLILSHIQFIVTRGEKIAFVGRNGEGKSTMMKIIAGKIPYEGKVQLGHNIISGYFEQDQEEKLNLEKTVYETIDELATGEIRKNIRDILGSFLFSGDDIHKKVKVLSGGERARLALCKLLLQPYNLLLLDEPTNHLDIQSKEILKQAIKNYEGTVIIVSHDRDFLSGLSNRIFEFKDKKIKEHLCSIDEFLNERKIQQLKELDIQSKSDKNLSIASSQKINVSLKNNKENKNLQSQIKKIEEKIENIETEIKNMDELLSNPEQYDKLVNDKNFFEKYNELKYQHEKYLKEWEDLIEKIKF